MLMSHVSPGISQRPLFLAAMLLLAVLPLSGQYQPGDSTALYAQSGFSGHIYAQKLNSGVNLYRESRWQEAISELRIAHDAAANNRQLSEALYWLALSQLAAADFPNALRNIEQLERLGSDRSQDIVYHKGRAYFHLERFQEAINMFSQYIAIANPRERGRISAAYFWISESYLALGQLDTAREFFQLITVHFPDSDKYEASVFRVTFISQKKVEQELLDMLRLGHEESLRTHEEYQRRERMYDDALALYQKQLAESQHDFRIAEMELANNEFRRQLAEAQNRIQSLERQLNIPSSGGASHEVSRDLMTWTWQLRITMYDILLAQPGIMILHDMCTRLDLVLAGVETITEEDLAMMELTTTLLKAQYNL